MRPRTYLHHLSAAPRSLLNQSGQAPSPALPPLDFNKYAHTVSAGLKVQTLQRDMAALEERADRAEKDLSSQSMELGRLRAERIARTDSRNNNTLTPDELFESLEIAMLANPTEPLSVLGLPSSASVRDYARTTPRGRIAILEIQGQLASLEDIIRSHIPGRASGASLHLDVDSDPNIRYAFDRLVKLLTALNPGLMETLDNTLAVLQRQLRRAFHDASTNNDNRFDLLNDFNQRWQQIAENFIRDALRTPMAAGGFIFRPHDPLPLRGTHEIIRTTVSAATGQPPRRSQAEIERRRRLQEYAEQRLTSMVTALERLVLQKVLPAVVGPEMEDIARQYARAVIAINLTARHIVGHIEQAAIEALSKTYQHFRNPQVLASTYYLLPTLRQNFTEEFHRYIEAIETHMNDDD